MKKIIYTVIIAATFTPGCKKENTNPDVENFTYLKAYAIRDFVNVVALPSYAELKAKAAVLNDAVVNLNNTTTDTNLDAAKNAWKDMRSTWEKSEGFLFGPVDSDEHDPETDTWPVNFVDLEALLSDNSHPLTVYTDLLLHDMGPGLADDRPDFLANGNEWKTPALWGIGLFPKTNGIPFYMHDGRARTIEEAILWHSGEAERSRQQFM